jgi:hypothetical protein
VLEEWQSKFIWAIRKKYHSKRWNARNLDEREKKAPPALIGLL